MHYTSNQLEHVKVGTVKPLVRREKIFCNTGELLTAELDYIKKIMWLNGYPEKQSNKHCQNNKNNQTNIVI